jgi:hypothetical protein
MKLEDLMRVDDYTANLQPPLTSILHEWSQTANGVTNKRSHEIGTILENYMKIGDALTRRQITTFLEDLVEVMRSDEDRRKLIGAEALQFKKFI